MKIVLAFSMFLALTACGPGRPDLRTLELNHEGSEHLEKQSFPSATEKYLEALRFDPFIGALHLNLGLSFEGGEQAEKALQSYKESESLALQDEDMGLVFMARFNQGQLLGKAKRVDEALEAYQKALEIIPNSLEVKTNIELLIQSQSGGGGDDKKDQNKDQNKGEGQDQQDKDGQDKDEKKDSDQPQEKKQSPKYKPRPFEGKELSEGDVKKILGELKQQEEKIRAEYNRKEVKEQPRDKDW